MFLHHRLAAAMPLHLCQMIVFIIRLVSLPQRPDNGQPTVGQAAIGMALRQAAFNGLGEVGVGPGRLLHGADSKKLSGVPILMMASAAKPDAALLATLNCDGTGACQGLNGSGKRKSLPLVAKHDQQFGSQ